MVGLWTLRGATERIETTKRRCRGLETLQRRSRLTGVRGPAVVDYTAVEALLSRRTR